MSGYEQLTLAGGATPVEQAQRIEPGNPLLRIYGPGPVGATCRTCVHLYALPGVQGHYLKCDLRRLTHGPSSDHRAKWQACAKYEPGR